MVKKNNDTFENDYSLGELKKLKERKDINSLIEISNKSNDLKTKNRCNRFIKLLLKNQN